MEYTEITDETKAVVKKMMITELETAMYQFELKLEIEKTRKNPDDNMIQYYSQLISEKQDQIAVIKNQ